MKPANPYRIFYWMVASLVASFALHCVPQDLGEGMQKVGCSSGVGVPSAPEARYRALRELEDPGAHQYWLLIRDRNRAAGPALLVKEPAHSACAFFTLGKMDRGPAIGQPVRSLPVIHAGDPIILFEHTTVSDTELEATALEQAAVGDSLRVHIKFGGFTVRAIAAAPGRATLGSMAKAWRP